MLAAQIYCFHKLRELWHTSNLQHFSLSACISWVTFAASACTFTATICCLSLTSAFSRCSVFLLYNWQEGKKKWSFQRCSFCGSRGEMSLRWPCQPPLNLILLPFTSSAGQCLISVSVLSSSYISQTPVCTDLVLVAVLLPCYPSSYLYIYIAFFWVAAKKQLV